MIYILDIINSMGLICSAKKVIYYLVSLSNNKGATVYIM